MLASAAIQQTSVKPHHVRAATQHPAAAGHQRQQEKRATEQFGPAGDVSHRLRHHRVRGKQEGGGQRHGSGILARRLSGGAVVRHPHGELKEQHDVQHVEQQVGQVEPERVQSPDGVVDGVREIDQRPRRLEEHDRAQVREILDARVLDDHAVIVVDERVGKRVEV